MALYFVLTFLIIVLIPLTSSSLIPSFSTPAASHSSYYSPIDALSFFIRERSRRAMQLLRMYYETKGRETAIAILQQTITDVSLAYRAFSS